MSRARDNADGARLDAPLASPAFTGTPTGITAAHLTTPAVLPAAVTGGSGLTALGTVTEGTLGANVNLNHDAQEDSWHIYLGANATYSSASQIDFTHNVFIGSDVSESGGAITVTNAGLYWVSVALAKVNAVAGAINCQLQVDGTAIEGCWLYVEDTGGSGVALSSRTISFPLRLAASQVVRVYGTGAMYGGTSGTSMCYFSGTRIGAKT